MLADLTLLPVAVYIKLAWRKFSPTLHAHVVINTTRGYTLDLWP